MSADPRDVDATGTDPLPEEEAVPDTALLDGEEALAEVPGADPRLAELTAERDQYRTLAQQVQADFENYRKRALAQQTDEVNRATGKVVEALLPVLDACELAYQHGTDGVEPIWSKLLGELQRQGLEPMDLQDKPFDPNEAEAVVHEPGDSHNPVVAEVLRTGYRWKGRVLRAAMVKVKG